ncbi:MAG TPA: outer membrane beta-barrel protein [Verrucomicrobiae bacterium]|nr:outer membrane beta-barrel protein [Verrucomicrobiae bacterium]
MAPPPVVNAPISVNFDPAPEEDREPGADPDDAMESSASTPRNFNPLVWGPFTLHPSVSYTFTHSTGMPIRGGRQEDSIVQSVTPSISINIGRRWVASYTPSLVFYSNEELDDRLQHTASLSGNAQFDIWSFSLGQNFSMSSESRSETATQTDQKHISTSLSAARAIGRDWSLQLQVSQSIADQSGYEDAQGGSRSWSTMNWLNYHLAPRISLAGGVGAGYVDVSSGTDMTHEQLQGRITFGLSQKLSASLNAGVEIRQFLDTDKGSLINPLFGLSVSYAATERTTLGLAASRNISTSFFRNQVTENTSVTATFTQQIFNRLALNMSASYTTTDYEATTSAVSTSRKDENLAYRASLSTAVYRRGSFSVFYARSENLSNSSGFDYASNQTGFSFSFGY